MANTQSALTGRLASCQWDSPSAEGRSAGGRPLRWLARLSVVLASLGGAAAEMVGLLYAILFLE